MGKPKDEFLRNESDVKAALGLVKSDTFLKLFNAARAEFSTRNPTAEQGRGVSIFEEVLFNMPEEHSKETSWDEVTTGERLDIGLEIPIRHNDKKSEPK